MRPLAFLAPNRRLSADSNRSPACAATDRAAHTHASTARRSRPAHAASPDPAMVAATAPPTAPDQVFFGLTAGHNFGPPSARPRKYAMTSVVQTTPTINRSARNPNPASPRSTAGAASIARA